MAPGTRIVMHNLYFYLSLSTWYHKQSYGKWQQYIIHIFITGNLYIIAILVFCPLYKKLGMSTASRPLKSPRSISSTSAHPTMVKLVNIMVMNGWLTSFSFHVNRLPHSWDKAISDSDLETPRSRSWVWSKAKVIQSAQNHTNSPPLISNQSDQKFLRYSYFKIWPRNFQGQGLEWGQRSRSPILPRMQLMHFRFVSHQSD